MIRYPGSKAKIVREILGHFPDRVLLELFQSKRLEYREPFFGGGAIGFGVLQSLPAQASVWLNDKDYGMAALWKAVHECPRELVQMIVDFKPTTDAFYQFQKEDSELINIDPVRAGFQKFALHQTSFSGLGAKAGGPIGGRKQSSNYNVSCRWNADRHCAEVMRLHRILKRFGPRVKITSGDFAPLLDCPPHAFVYADPPYYEKGEQLYKFNMSDDDHRRLADLLKQCRAPWVLSYDDHALIRELYSWADIRSVALTYTIASAKTKRRKNSEVVITRQDNQRSAA